MARCAGVFLLALSAGRAALSADTGMLYVKSDPPGATVVIEGKERGKTPVLVKNLPAGETAVELRIEGAKPVAVRETVLARKVVTVTAEIDVPVAMLTVISDPLEATVYLDKREHGKTPLTIQDLAPGRHELLLMKTGFPNTVRSVVLAAGEERVLEVKLGTAAEDERAKLQAAVSARTPEALAAFLDKFVESTDAGDYEGARIFAEAVARERGLAEFKADIAAAGEVAKLLEGLKASARRGGKALVGKEVELVTKAGGRQGRVKAVDDEGITLVKEIVVNGSVMGGSESRVAWADLTPAAEAELAADWSPEGVKGAVARALAARVRGDADGAMRVLEEAGEEPIGRHLRGKAAAAEEEVRAAWSDVEKRASATDLSAGEIKDLLRTLKEFQKQHGTSPFAVSLGDRVEKVRARLETTLDVVARIPADAVKFGGHYYRLYTEAPMTWDRAKVFCERQKGHLATITSHEEATFIGGLFRNADEDAWVGLTDVRQEGRWEWVTGEKFTFALWGRQEPNNMDGNQDHVRVFTDPGVYGDRIGRLDDEQGTKAKFFICEWEPGGKE